MKKSKIKQGKTYEIITLGIGDRLHSLRERFEEKPVNVIRVLGDYGNGHIKAEVQFLWSFGFADKDRNVTHIDHRELYFFNSIGLG